MKFLLCKLFQAFNSAKPNYGLKVIFTDGSVFLAGNNPEVTIIFKNKMSQLKTVIFGEVGFIESYIEGHIDLLGEDAFRKILQMGYSLPLQAKHYNPLMRLRLLLLEAKNSNKNFEKARRNAYAHYNLPAGLFRIMLGNTMGYTEGYWITGKESLDEAQRNKFDYICRKLCLRRGDKLVEVGTGWGYMSVLAAEKYGAEVVNYGIVESQNRIFEKRVRAKKLGSRVRNAVKDHRELINEPNTYDKYVSIGVYEHAGKDCQREWIAGIAKALKPGGIGFISTSSHMRRLPMEYLFAKYIFPGAYIPSIAEMIELMEDHGLNVVDMESMRHHYQLTLEHWYRRFLRNWHKIEKLNPNLFNERFKRMWIVYLGGAAETFKAEHQKFDAFHIVFTKGRSEKYYPANRNFLYSINK